MKRLLLLISCVAVAGCATPKQFLRPMNYNGVEKAKTLMESQGYVPVKGTNKEVFVVKGEDADLYRSELEEYRLTETIARTAQMQGDSYTLPVEPSVFGLRTITAEAWFENNQPGANSLANVIDTLWDGLLVGGTLYAGQELTDAFNGDDDDGDSSDTTITAGGNVNYVDGSAVGGSVGSVPVPVTVEGIEP